MLKGRVALVSGASRGIGRAIVERFYSEGAIVYAGVRNKDIFKEIERYDSESEARIIPIILDVCDKESIKQCMMDIKKNHGRLDILVNNAGTLYVERLEMARDSSMQQIYETNVFGLFHVTQMAVRLLKKSMFASIINISSVLWDKGDIGQTLYASSKAAVTSMTKTWAKEYVHMGLRVNAIAPGNTDTDMYRRISDKEYKEELSRIGMGRIADPDEIAKVALFLASDMSSYITGETIAVDGGLIL
ncbi:MAG: SDR family oxidoreductase [Lachnospiraceae bacterium]|nr:SDR family oxidoreductase [Lachnospiraceae bacterium]